MNKVGEYLFEGSEEIEHEAGDGGVQSSALAAALALAELIAAGLKKLHHSSNYRTDRRILQCVHVHSRPLSSQSRLVSLKSGIGQSKARGPQQTCRGPYVCTVFWAGWWPAGHTLGILEVFNAGNE